ncbi:hypothetical protein [Leptospirillum ferriphilum]|uniref:hypothetical protein n=1 Tax=Leptospirillum ferriphilum TaxID=178606 RepID=UPI000AAB7CB0|nr:hypothetical protein [Leptospirillum ferriphilum]
MMHPNPGKFEKNEKKIDAVEEIAEDELSRHAREQYLEGVRQQIQQGLDPGMAGSSPDYPSELQDPYGFLATLEELISIDEESWPEAENDPPVSPGGRG